MGLIFTYGLTVLGGAGGLIAPFFGLCVYIAFSILRPDFMWEWSVPRGNYSRIVGISMLIGWALRGFGSWKLGRATLIIGCLIGYWFWMILSTIYAQDQDRAWGLVIFYAKVLGPVLVGITTIDSVRKLKILGWVILHCMGFVALQMNLYYFGGYNYANLIGFGGMDNNCLAIAMVSGVGLAFFLGMGTEKWWMKGLALLYAALIAHTIMLTFSRGGLLSLALTGMMAFYLIPKTPKHWFMLLVAVALGIRMAGPQVQERFMTAFVKKDDGNLEASAQSRLDLWRDALDLTMENPIFGVGGDNWGLYASEYGWPANKEAHSLWVQNLCELGVPGTLMLMGFFGFCFVRLWPIARGRGTVSDPWMRDGARMIVSSLFGFVVAAQFVTIKYLEVPFYICMLGAGILKLNEPKPASRFSSPLRPARRTMAIRQPVRAASSS